MSNYRVTPVVAVAERRPALVAQPTEVAAILEAPVAAFLPDGEIVLVEREIRGWTLRYGGYPVAGLARLGHDGDGPGRPRGVARRDDADVARRGTVTP